METKRCAYCHKLQRAGTRVCSRCGRSFERQRSRAGGSWRNSVSLFSHPVASPHHAGHYSGLHPEDQPYQSNKIVVPQRVMRDIQEQKSLSQEPEHIVLPPTQNPPVTKMYRDSSQVPTRRQVPARRSRRQSAPEESLRENQETQRQNRRNQQLPQPFVQDVNSQLEETQRPLRAGAIPAPAKVVAESYKLYDNEYVLDEIQQPQHLQKRHSVGYGLAPELSLIDDATLSSGDFPTYVYEKLPARPRFSRLTSTMLVATVFLLLLAANIVVLILIGKHPVTLHAQLKVTPQLLGVHDTFSLEGNGFTPNHTVTFTINTNTAVTGENGQPLHANTDTKGHFLLHTIVPPAWSVGSHVIYAIDQASMQRFSANITVQATLPLPPHLLLLSNHNSFGSSAAGVVSSQTITLENSGGGMVIWQESSNQPWLTASPNRGTFAQSENIQLDVNRGGMAPGNYSGLVTIWQQGQEHTPSILSVTMTVAPLPAQISVSVTTLSYSTAQSQTPKDQVLTIGNTGEQPLNWDATTSTEDGASWLTLSLYHGVIPSGVYQALNVQIDSQTLPVGTYTGMISFTGNANAVVRVSLTVVTPGNLVISPPSLPFTSQQTTQTLSLQNSGGQSLNWTITPSTNDHGNWLSVTSASGILAPGETTTISVHADPTNLPPASYQGTLTFSVGDQTQQIAISFVITATTPTPVPTPTSTPTATISPTSPPKTS